MKEVERLPLKDFTRYCMSIAQVPSSYIAGLTIEEQLLWLCSFLTNEVIPTVNNNGEAVEELQQLYVQLHDYVENYFDNLDIQAEVNAKLEDMAQSGELAELISQYLESQAIIGFNTCSALAAAENLANGSLVKTYGQNNYSDNKGAFYRVRTRINADDPDGYNLIELTNTENLVAQKVSYSDYELNSQISDNTSRIDEVERVALYIGNSYINGTGSTSGTDGIFNLTKDMFKAAYKKAGSGTGWLTYTDHTNDTFNTLLNNAVSDSSIPKNDITDIIIVGAWGESRALNELEDNLTTFASNVQTAIGTFNSTVAANFPNVKRVSYIYGESRAQKIISHQYPTYFFEPFWVHNRFINLLPKNGIEYLGWIGFNIMLDSQYFNSDKIHPNDAGYKQLSTLFKSAYNGRFEYLPIRKAVSSTASTVTSGSTLKMTFTILPNQCSMNIRQLTLASGSTPAHGSTCSLMDFKNISNYSLPIPSGLANYELGTAITMTTKRPQDSGFNVNDNFYAKVSLEQSTDEPDSTNVKLTTYGGSKTVSQSLTSMVTPFEINWNLGYTM